MKINSMALGLSIIMTVLNSTANGATLASADSLSNQQLTQELYNLQAQIKQLSRQNGRLAKRSTSEMPARSDKGAVSDDEGRWITDLEHNYHGSAVVSSPTFGTDSVINGGMINDIPSINGDLAILKYRQSISRHLTKQGWRQHYPTIALGGCITVEGGLVRNFDRSSNSNVALGTAELDALVELNSWMSGFFSISYEADKSELEPRISKSRLKLDKGYLVIGNLDRTPFYIGAGQMFAPFGSFSSFRLTTAPTKVIGRNKDQVITLGLNQKYLTAQIFLADNELRYAHGGKVFDHIGASLNLFREWQDWRVKFGVSYTGALAEADGILLNAFKTTKTDSNGATSSGSNTLHQKVRGFAVSGRISYKNLTLLAEYVTALNHFDEQDLSFNGHGALPRALELEASLSFKTFGKASSLSAGWGQSWESLALKLPRSSIFAAYKIAVLKNTTLGMEYHHDFNYSESSYAKGSGTLKTITPAGKHRDVYLLKLEACF